MGIFLIILSIVLILLSFILLFITPFAFLGIILGFFGIIYGRSYKKRPQRLKTSSKPPQKDPEQQEPAVSLIHYVEHIPISGVSADAITPFLIGEENIDRENVMIFERGDKIFRNIYSFDAAIISVSGKDVLVNGNPFAHLLPKNLEKYERFISEHPDSWLSLDVSFGHYAEIVRNPDYDRDIDDEDERNMVEYDSLDKPRATLSIHYTTERSYS